MKNLLILFILIPINILVGMESKYSYKKNTCNLGYDGFKLHDGDCGLEKYSRWEAFKGKKCIGSVHYNKNQCFLNALWVVEKYRGKTLGKSLFLKAIQDMKESGCEKIIWQTTSNAEYFYKKLGAECMDYSCQFMFMFTNLEKK